MLITTQTKDCTSSMRSAWLRQYHQIHCSSPGQTPVRKKMFGADTFHLAYKSDIISEQPMSACLAPEGTRQGGSCLEIWCTRSCSHIHHLNVSLSANFVECRVGRQKSISPKSILMILCSSGAALRTKNSIVMSTSWCQVKAVNMAFYSSSFIQAATGYKCWKFPFILVFHYHFSTKQ